MKKTGVSLILFSIIALTGCKFNISNSKYLDRPDVVVRDGHFEIIAPYISTNTEQITIYRKNVHDREDSAVERVAIIFPKGVEDTTDQTFHYDDYRVLAANEYRYYLRFTDKNGQRNRTEWSDKKILTSGGASAASKLQYDVKNLSYTYTPETMVFTLPTGQDFAKPDNSVITDIDDYKPALVFQAGENIQVFEVPEEDTTTVHLKALLPETYLYTDVVLLGIVGQKIEYNSKNAELYKCISWTNITPIKVVNRAGNELETFKLEPEYGEAGFDYSTTSDNEN